MKRLSLFAALAALILSGCTSLPPLRSARSLQAGKDQGNLSFQSVQAAYSKDIHSSGSADDDESHIQDIAAVSGEFRGGTQAPGLDIGVGLGSLSSLYLDMKYQLLGTPWRQGFAAALDGQLDYFPFALFNENQSQISTGFGGSAGLTLGQFVGIGDLNVGGRFGTVPAGTLYAYYTLFDIAGLNAPSSNYYEVNASLDFALSPRIGLNLGGAYRTYLRRDSTFSTSSEYVRIGLPGFFLAALTLSFGNQPPMTQDEASAAPKSRRQRRDEDLTAQLETQGKEEMDVKDYAKAAAVLTEAEGEGADGETLDMRLGYCYYQLKDWGQSLNYYRKAQLFAPDDEKIKSVIEKLEKKVPEKAAPEDDAPLPQ